MDPGAANRMSVQLHSPTSIPRTNKHTIKVALTKVATARCLFPNIIGHWPSFRYPVGNESKDSSLEHGAQHMADNAFIHL
jgi:hypothetical protein